jgi:hypothetical protein
MLESVPVAPGEQSNYEQVLAARRTYKRKHRVSAPVHPLVCGSAVVAVATWRRRVAARGACVAVAARQHHQLHMCVFFTFIPTVCAGPPQTALWPTPQTRGAAHRGSRRQPRGTLERARRAVQRGRPARLRPSTPRRCGSCAAALGTMTTVACQVVGSRARCHRVRMATRSRSVVRTPEPRGERAMGAALTRPTGIASASARAPACGV